MKVETQNILLGKKTKPKLEKFEPLHIEKDDLLILCAGFEERALAALKKIISFGQTNLRVLIIEYLPELKNNRAKEIINLCLDNKIDFFELKYNRYDPFSFGEQIYPIIGENSKKVYLDISAMTRLLIVQIIVGFGQSIRKFNNFKLIYTEAEEYFPKEDKIIQMLKSINNIYRDIFISSGVFEVTVIPELSSVSSYDLTSRLIVFPSFNSDQLFALKADLQPSYFSFINGIPPSSENSWRTDVIRKINKIDTFPRKEEYNCSTLDYVETLDQLIELYSKYSYSNRLLLSPIGSKMQTVAVGIFRTYLNDVQIVYPTPREYAHPKVYTSGIKNMYILNLESFSI